MSHAGLIVIAALCLSALAAPTVFATSSAAAPVLRAPVSAGSPIGPEWSAAVDRWCAERDDPGCAAWQREAHRPHALQQTQTHGGAVHAWVPLRQTAMRLHIEAHQSGAGWGISAVHGERTMRCGTPGFALVRRAVRSASPAWAARVDGCAPDALRPIEVERAALRPVLIQGEVSTAWVQGPQALALDWRDGAWRPRR